MNIDKSFAKILLAHDSDISTTYYYPVRMRNKKQYGQMVQLDILAPTDEDLAIF